MASEIGIVNSALTKLGAARIISLDANQKEAREMKALYTLRRDALLRGHFWNFARKRTSLPALVAGPAWGYAYAYQLPADFMCLRQVNDYWCVPSMADYMNAPDSEPYKLETLNDQRVIVTDFGAPLKIAYTWKVENAGLFDPLFAELLACDLAFNCAEALTQSSTKKESARDDMTQALLLARRANAIELPPEAIADDAWILSRL